MKRRFDEKRKPCTLYSVGDLVLIRMSCNAATGQNQKLLPKRRDPFKITQVLENDRYVVDDIPGCRRSRLSYKSTAGIGNMKHWVNFSM